MLFRLPYKSIFGGISAMTRQQVEKINGFSNDYWGWGGEDDDLSTRVSVNGYKIMRYPNEIARYKMVKHSKEKSNPVNGYVYFCLMSIFSIISMLSAPNVSVYCIYYYDSFFSCRYTLMRRTRMRFRRDGLSNLNYKVIKAERKHLYTNINVDLLEAESRERLHNEQKIFKKC